MTTTILYHNDADGFAAALAAWLRYGDNAHYIEVAYGKPVPEIPAYTKRLFILDFSYSREVCDLLATQYELVVLDHHKTAQEALRGAPYAIFDMSKAGCELAWEYFYPAAELPELLAYVADRDLWLWELPESKEINAWVSTLPKQFSVWATHALCWDGDMAAMCGRSILASHAHLLGIMASGAKFIEIAGLPAVVVNSTQALHSELAEFLGQRFPGAAIVAIYNDQANGTRKYSLRTTRADVDVSAIARQYGGGGHRKAAGFELPPHSYPSSLCMGGELGPALKAIERLDQAIEEAAIRQGVVA